MKNQQWWGVSANTLITTVLGEVKIVGLRPPMSDGGWRARCRLEAGGLDASSHLMKISCWGYEWSGHAVTKSGAGVQQADGLKSVVEVGGGPHRAWFCSRSRPAVYGKCPETTFCCDLARNR